MPVPQSSGTMCMVDRSVYTAYTFIAVVNELKLRP